MAERIVLRSAMAFMLLTAGCDSTAPSKAPQNHTATPSAVPSPERSTSPQKLSLAPNADEKSIGIVRDLAEAAFREPVLVRDQSFRIMESDLQVATLVTGEGFTPETPNRTCFAAIVTEDRPAIVSTIGTGNWEAETCISADAVAVLHAGNVTEIGIIYRASSPNAETMEPLVLEWDRRTGSLRIDAQKSILASQEGVRTIRALQRFSDGLGDTAAARLPAEVQAFIGRREKCDHLRGEDRPGEDLQEMTTSACAGTDAALADLRRRHADNRLVMASLADFEDMIE